MRLTPRDTRFHDLSTTAAGHVRDGANLLVQLVESPAADRPPLTTRLGVVEHASADTTHDIMRGEHRLHHPLRP